MKEDDLDELLWDVGRLAPEDSEEGSSDERPSDERPSEDLLARYRAGALDEAASEELERQLAVSAAGRERLMAGSSADDEKPPAAVRQRILEQFADPKRPDRQGSDRQATRSARRRRAWWASAALAASLVLALLGPLRQTSHLPPDLAYDVAVQGNAWVRSGASEPSTVEEAVQIDVETEIRLVATPREAAVAGLELGLYRQGPQGLTRLSAAEGLRTETVRGGAIFRGRAGDLLGETPGRHLLFLTVAAAGDLPAEITPAVGQSPATALAVDGRRLVFPIPIHLQTDPASAESVDREG